MDSFEEFFIGRGYYGVELEKMVRFDPKVGLDTTLPVGECKVRIILAFAKYLDVNFPDDFDKIVESKLIEVGVKTKVCVATRDDLFKLLAFR
jgi:hypothetical protein